MKSIKSIMSVMALAGMALLGSCENDNINPRDFGGVTTDSTETGSSDVITTALASYPKGSIVWTKDTTLTESFKVPEGVSLYIEPGVTVTANSKADPPIELVVLGNLYCMGTADKPVTFTSDTKKTEDWGGIICGYNSEEVVLNHTNFNYAGATPTGTSISVQNHLFKTEIDGGVPAFHFCNVNGRFVITNCVFNESYNDQTYFTGGSCIIANNIFKDSGNAKDGGEAINFKSGCKADIAGNVIYNACTNAFKLSNSGVSEEIPSSQLNIYNNTVVNCGWRRSKNKKGGSVWLEKGIEPVFVNNIIYDCRFGVKQPDKDGAGKEAVCTPNYLFASTAAGVSQFSASEPGVMFYQTDVHSSKAGDMDPLFVNYSLTKGMNINCETDDQTKGAPQYFVDGWDFHLKAGSPALNASLPAVTPLWSNGLVFIGLKKVIFKDINNDMDYRFYSPVPAARYGALGLAE